MKFDPRHTVLFAFAAAAIAGCGGSDSTASDTTGSGGGGGAPTEMPDAIYHAGPFNVPSAQEIVMCTYVRGTNDEDEDIVAFDTEQSVGGHHLIVYTLDHEVDLPPTACSQGGEPGWNQILVTQVLQQHQVFPPGVGFRVAAHQQYVIETHYINTTSKPITAKSSFATTYGAKGSVDTRAATYFFGTMNIDVPANGSFHATADCTAPFAMNLHTMFGHEHRTGTGVTVDVEEHEAMKQVYKTETWDNPPITSFSPALDVATGTHIHVSCDWNNTTTEDLRYPNEMCFAIGYYWPADTGLACVAGGGDDSKCECQYPGKTDTGPGGSTVVVEVQRQDTIEHSKGSLDDGAPIYCALYREQDWGGIVPKAGAQPYYFRDQVGMPLASDKSVVSMTVNDVTPGDYRIACMMDTIGGGFVPGSGDVVNITAPEIHPVKGKTTNAKVMLDFAMP